MAAEVSGRVGMLLQQQQPSQTTNGGMQNASSVGTRARCAHVFARLGADLRAKSVPVDEIPASELSRKFTKVALLVGHYYQLRYNRHAFWGKTKQTQGEAERERGKAENLHNNPPS